MESFEQSPSLGTVDKPENKKPQKRPLEKFLGFFSEKLGFDTVELRTGLREDLEYLQNVYGLRVEMHRQTPEDQHFVKVIEKLNLREAASAVKIIREEVSKYPKEYIKQCGVKSFRLVKGLWWFDQSDKSLEPVGGLAYRNTRFVYATYSKDRIQFCRRIIHHELFHRSDQKKLEDIARFPVVGSIIAEEKEYWDDDSWASLNPKGVGYLRDRYKQREKHSSSSRPRGFACFYGTKNEWEDRATIAEELMTDPIGLKIKGEFDPVLQTKIDRLKNIFRKRSKGLLNDHYFQDLENKSVKGGYWGY